MEQRGNTGASDAQDQPRSALRSCLQIEARAGSCRSFQRGQRALTKTRVTRVRAKPIREVSDGHVMALTRLGDEEDVMHGLQLGADEYLAKPISKRMFLVRVRTILRRALTPAEIPTDYSDSCLNLSFFTHQAMLHGDELALRPLEFLLLSYLARNHDRVVGHEEILDNVWGVEEGSKDNLRWFIASLRQKLDEACKDSRLIVTFPKVGYRYQVSDACPHSSA